LAEDIIYPLTPESAMHVMFVDQVEGGTAERAEEQHVIFVDQLDGASANSADDETTADHDAFVSKRRDHYNHKAHAAQHVNSRRAEDGDDEMSVASSRRDEDEVALEKRNSVNENNYEEPLEKADREELDENRRPSRGVRFAA